MTLPVLCTPCVTTYKVLEPQSCRYIIEALALANYLITGIIALQMFTELANNTRNLKLVKEES